MPSRFAEQRDEIAAALPDFDLRQRFIALSVAAEQWYAAPNRMHDPTRVRSDSERALLYACSRLNGGEPLDHPERCYALLLDGIPAAFAVTLDMPLRWSYRLSGPSHIAWTHWMRSARLIGGALRDASMLAFEDYVRDALPAELRGNVFDADWLDEQSTPDEYEPEDEPVLQRGPSPALTWVDEPVQHGAEVRWQRGPNARVVPLNPDGSITASPRVSGTVRDIHVVMPDGSHQHLPVSSWEVNYNRDGIGNGVNVRMELANVDNDLLRVITNSVPANAPGFPVVTREPLAARIRRGEEALRRPRVTIENAGGYSAPIPPAYTTHRPTDDDLRGSVRARLARRGFTHWSDAPQDALGAVINETMRHYGFTSENRLREMLGMPLVAEGPTAAEVWLDEHAPYSPEPVSTTHDTFAESFEPGVAFGEVRSERYVPSIEPEPVHPTSTQPIIPCVACYGSGVFRYDDEPERVPNVETCEACSGLGFVRQHEQCSGQGCSDCGWTGSTDMSGGWAARGASHLVARTDTAPQGSGDGRDAPASALEASDAETVPRETDVQSNLRSMSAAVEQIAEGLRPFAERVSEVAAQVAPLADALGLDQASVRCPATFRAPDTSSSRCTLHVEHEGAHHSRAVRSGVSTWWVERSRSRPGEPNASEQIVASDATGRTTPDGMRCTSRFHGRRCVLDVSHLGEHITRSGSLVWMHGEQDVVGECGAIFIDGDLRVHCILPRGHVSDHHGDVPALDPRDISTLNWSDEDAIRAQLTSEAIEADVQCSATFLGNRCELPEHDEDEHHTNRIIDGYTLRWIVDENGNPLIIDEWCSNTAMRCMSHAHGSENRCGLDEGHAGLHISRRGAETWITGIGESTSGDNSVDEAQLITTPQAAHPEPF